MPRRGLAAVALLGALAAVVVPTAVRGSVGDGASATLAARHAIVTTWSGGYTAGITIENRHERSIAWSELRFDTRDTIDSMWNGNHQQRGDDVVVRPESYNQMIPAGSSVTIGYTARGGARSIDNCTLDGAPCADAGEAPTTTAPLTPSTVSPSTTTSTAAVTPSLDTNAPTTSDAAATGTSPSQGATNDARVVMSVGATWRGGYTGYLSITNVGEQPMLDWYVELGLEVAIANAWNAEHVVVGPDRHRFSARSWNRRIDGGDTVTIGFTAAGSATTVTSCSIIGRPCARSVDTPDSPTTTSPTITPTATSTTAPTTTEPTTPATDPTVSTTSTTTSPATSTTTSTVPALQGGGPVRVVGYFTSWGIYGRDFQVADIPAGKLTHINYAFVNVVDGRCVIGDRWADVDRPLGTDDPSLSYRGNFNQLQGLKQRHPHLRTLLAVGGWTWSGGFSSATATAARRKTLASSCVDMMETYGFDGLDIDWEYPVAGGLSGGSPDDRKNHALFIAELRRQLDAVESRTGSERLLTIAAPAGPTPMRNLDIAALWPNLDWVNLMTYDLTGAWSPRTGHNAPLYAYDGIEDPTFSVDSAVRRWIGAGVPAKKLALGLAFYGRGFGSVAEAAPGQPFAGVPMGTSELGQFDYSHLAESVLPQAERYFDETARVPYAYDPAARTWFSYDDERSIEEKAAYSAAMSLGGVMIWELSNDAGTALLDAAYRGLR